MGNKCIGEVDIFAAKDGIYVSDPSCYVVGSDVVKYSKKSTTIDGVTTVTYIDEAGVETASLPVGAEQIDCSKVVFVGNSTGGSSTAGDAGISTLLYDFVPSDGSSITVEHVDDQTMQSFNMYYAEPHPSGQGVTFPATTQPYDYQHVIMPITNLTVGATVYVAAGFYQTPFPNPLTYTVQETGENITKDYGEQITFVATEPTHFLQLSAFGVHDGFSIYNVSAATISVSQYTCTPFLRTIKDGATTDTDLDGQPYTVVGEVRTSCPDAQTEPACTCADEFQALKASVDTVAALFETKYISPEYSYHTAGYTVMNYYKSLTVKFIEDGTINGEHAPAGYSFTHPREIGVTYERFVSLDGTGFAVWEDR